MSNEKIKDMGNLSRAGNEIKKKLELSFVPQPEKTPVNQNTEIGKSVNTEIPISGNSGFKAASINTESPINQLPSSQDAQISSTPKIGSRYKKIVPRASDSIKSKATFCLDTIASEQLNLIYIKRLSSHQKSDRSSLICEAISLLFEKEKIE